MQTCTVYALLEWFSSTQNSHNTSPSGNNQVDDSSDSDSDGVGQVIGIAIVVVLLVVAIACIVGLVIWNIKLHKKNLQLQTPNQWVIDNKVLFYLDVGITSQTAPEPVLQCYNNLAMALW